MCCQTQRPLFSELDPSGNESPCIQQSLFKGEEQRRQAALDHSRSAEDLLERLPDLQKRAADNSINFAEYKGTRYLMDLIRKIVGAGSGSTFLSESDIRDLRTKQFNQACGLTGAILTKLDGSGRGGMAVALQQELGIPVRFTGTGGKETDFALFDPKKFAAEMM